MEMTQKVKTALNQVMTVREIADEYGVDVKAVLQLINRNPSALHVRKSGGTWLVLRSSAHNRYGNKK